MSPLHVEHISHEPRRRPQSLHCHAAGLRFGDPQAQALLAVLLIFRLHPHGFTNADLRNHLTRVHNRLIRIGEAQLADPQPPAPAPLRAAAHAYNTALDQLIRQAGLAA